MSSFSALLIRHHVIKQHGVSDGFQCINKKTLNFLVLDSLFVLGRHGITQLKGDCNDLAIRHAN
jgi:hypothetical protein